MFLFFFLFFLNCFCFCLEGCDGHFLARQRKNVTNTINLPVRDDDCVVIGGVEIPRNIASY